MQDAARQRLARRLSLRAPADDADELARGALHVARPLAVGLRDRLEHRKAGSDGTLCVITVGYERSENSHHGVADEFLHGPAEVLDLFLGGRMVRMQGVSDVFGIRSVGPAREADEVHEKHRNQLAFLLRRLLFQRCAAREAEPSSSRVVLTAPRTRHGRSLTLRSHPSIRKDLGNAVRTARMRILVDVIDPMDVECVPLANDESCLPRGGLTAAAS